MQKLLARIFHEEMSRCADCNSCFSTLHRIIKSFWISNLYWKVSIWFSSPFGRATCAHGLCYQQLAVDHYGVVADALPMDASDSWNIRAIIVLIIAPTVIFENLYKPSLWGRIVHLKVFSPTEFFYTLRFGVLKLFLAIIKESKIDQINKQIGFILHQDRTNILGGLWNHIGGSDGNSWARGFCTALWKSSIF